MRMTENIFNRTELLVGDDVMKSIASKKVIVFGVGGVGSWCVEALVRSGIQRITIVDSDRVCVSNINRQLMATTQTVGQVKVEALKERLLQINPKAEITALQTGNLLYAAAVPVSQTLVVEDGDGVESTSSDGIEIKVLLKEGFLHLSFSQPMGDGCRIRLFNMNGVLVRSDILSGDNLCKWDMHGLSSGVYLIKVESEVYFTTLKIIL